MTIFTHHDGPALVGDVAGLDQDHLEGVEVVLGVSITHLLPQLYRKPSTKGHLAAVVKGVNLLPEVVQNLSMSREATLWRWDTEAF